MRRAFKVKQKVFFISFKGLSVAKNCLRPESVPLKVKGLVSQKELEYFTYEFKKSAYLGKLYLLPKVH